MARQEVALHRTAGGPRCDAALGDLKAQLGDEAVGAPDDAGMLAVSVAAESHEDAVRRVRDAIAAAGADECFELGEPSGYVPHDE